MTNYPGLDLGYGGARWLNEIFERVPGVLEPDLGVSDLFSRAGNVELGGRHVIFKGFLGVSEGDSRLDHLFLQGGDVLLVEDGESLSGGDLVAFFDHDLRDYAGGSECEGLSVGQTKAAGDGDFLDQVSTPDWDYLLVFGNVGGVLG